MLNDGVRMTEIPRAYAAKRHRWSSLLVSPRTHSYTSLIYEVSRSGNGSGGSPVVKYIGRTRVYSLILQSRKDELWVASYG